MAWPTPQDYNEAVQNPQLNFSDAELKAGVLELTPMGLPRVASGAFASVYRMSTGKRDVAVRCFLHNVADQQHRYEAISKFVCHDNLECTVDFEYVSQGVRISGAWYPLLKMEWAAGLSLDTWVRANLQNSKALTHLCETFKMMLKAMRDDGIAHGDLQHGNLIIQDDISIRLVDYDGMFVPALSGLQCNELGHRNYQHPLRTQDNFGPYLDNFAAWSIYTSLFCLSKDSSLMDKVKGGDESLLFRQYDYKNPTKSRTFATLEDHADAEIKEAARKFRAMLAMAPDVVPYLDDAVQAPENLPEMQLHKKLTNTNLPTWMLSDDVDPQEHEVDFRESIDIASRIAQAAPADAHWPTVNQYMAALTTPAACFSDPELKASRPHRIDGRVAPYSCSQNAVFRMEQQSAAFAVKVFLHPDPARSRRYKEFAEFLRSDFAHDSDIHKFIPRVDYQENGIRVGDHLYPIVKMQWILGNTIEAFEPNELNAPMLESMKTQFRRLMEAMRKANMVHGELEPSNLIISSDGLRLIDFDAVLVPKGIAAPAHSVGKYRHPMEPPTVDAHSDLLPAWFIDTALVVLREQPELRFVVPASKFLFERSDIEHPEESDVFEAMKNSKSLIVNRRGQLLKSLITDELRWMIPRLRSDAGIDASFAKEHGLEFVEIDRGLVSPDARATEAPVYVPTPLFVAKDPVPFRLISPKQMVRIVGGTGLFGMTVYVFVHAAVLPAFVLIFLLVVWNKVFDAWHD